MKNPALIYEVSFFSALWMVFPESWKRSCPNFYAHDCTSLSKSFFIHFNINSSSEVKFLNLDSNLEVLSANFVTDFWTLSSDLGAENKLTTPSTTLLKHLFTSNSISKLSPRFVLRPSRESGGSFGGCGMRYCS